MMLEQLGIDFKWLAAIALAGITGAFKYLHSKIVTVENMVLANGSKSEAAQREENNKLWDAMERHRLEFTTFKDRVLSENATKGDLHATEKRIMAAIEKVGPYRGDRQ